jgi:hypothetical protein
MLATCSRARPHWGSHRWFAARHGPAQRLPRTFSAVAVSVGLAVAANELRRGPSTASASCRPRKTLRKAAPRHLCVNSPLSLPDSVVVTVAARKGPSATERTSPAVKSEGRAQDV